MKVWVSSLLVLSTLAGPAWAYRDKKLEEAVAKAEEQIAKGKPEEAAKGMLKAAQGLKTGEAYVALGRIQAKTGTSTDEAVESFAKAKELGAQDGEVLAAVAVFELQTAPAKQALATATAAANAPGSGPDAKAALSLALTASNDASGGMKAAEVALAAAPTLSLAHEAKGQSLFVTGNTSGALASLRKAVELDAKSESAWVKISVVLSAEGKAAEAEAAAKSALEINKNSAQAMAAKAVAIVGVDVKRWSEAISDAQQGAFMNARSAFMHLSVGKVFEANGNLEQASQSYQKALEADPGFVAARLALVSVQNLRGDTKGTLAEAQKLVKDIPASGDAHLLLAKAYIAVKDYKSAEPELAKAAELIPGNAEAHAYLAAINFANGKDQVALEEYKKALALKPDNGGWRSDYALLLARSDRAEEGLQELRKVVDAPGYNDPAGFVNLGYLYRRMKPPKTDEAAAAYHKALQMKPKDDMAAQANLGLGWAFLSAKRHDEAIAPFESAVRLDARLAPEAYNGMGWCYLFKRDVAQAKSMVAKAREAGRPDADLAESVDKFVEAQAKGQAAYEQALKIAEQRRAAAAQMESIDVTSPKVATRLRAVKSLSQLPNGEGAGNLIYLLSADPDFGVREAAAVALGEMGRAAAGAVKYLKANMTMNCQGSIVGGTRDEITQELACEDLKRTSRQVLQKLGGS